jgi:hypothetical protein
MMLATCRAADASKSRERVSCGNQRCVHARIASLAAHWMPCHAV